MSKGLSKGDPAMNSETLAKLEALRHDIRAEIGGTIARWAVQQEMGVSQPDLATTIIHLVDARLGAILAEAPGEQAGLEACASEEHKRWARWYFWQRDHSTPENIERWNRQAVTPYADLSESEKESDRNEARLLLAHAPAQSSAEGGRCADCGAILNTGEAQTFTVCDTCWNKAYKPPTAQTREGET
jgi:hypothetical protein